jgi:hypothetical protein
MTLQHLEEIAGNRSNKVIFVYLEELIDEQFNAFVELGGSDHQNIIPIIQAHKA